MPHAAQTYIGVVFDIGNLPPGFERRASGLMEGNYDYGLVEMDVDEETWIYLQKKACEVPGGTIYWEVLDILVLPRLEEPIIGNICVQDDVPDHEVIAIANFPEHAMWSSEVLQAWRASITAETISSIPTTGWQCARPPGDY